MQGRLIRTSTSKDYVLPRTAVNFAIGGEQRCIAILVEVQEGMGIQGYLRDGCKSL